MTRLFQSLGEWSWLVQRKDDDFYDRLSYHYTTGVLIAMSVLTGGRQLLSERIRCWTPTEINFHQANYVNDYCYVSNTYHVPINEPLSGLSDVRDQRINYYQWVSIFILVQSVMFIIPKLIWRILGYNNGYYVSNITQRLLDVSTKAESNENRQQMMSAAIIYTDRYLASVDTQRNISCCRFRYRFSCGCKIIVSYTLIKVFYLMNAIGQIFLINKFLGESGYDLWGLHVIREFFNSGIIKFSDIFPIVTLCDISVRFMGDNTNTYTVQCILPVNVFYDRVYLMIWFWLSIVSAFTLFGLLSWLASNICQERHLLRHLQQKGRCYSEHDLASLREFIDRYLFTEGLFMLKIVSVNIPCIEYDEYLSCLWDHFLEKRSHRNNIEETDLSENSYKNYKKSIECVDGGDFVVTF